MVDDIKKKNTEYQRQQLEALKRKHKSVVDDIKKNTEYQRQELEALKRRYKNEMDDIKQKNKELTNRKEDKRDKQLQYPEERHTRSFISEEIKHWKHLCLNVYAGLQHYGEMLLPYLILFIMSVFLHIVQLYFPDV